MPYYCYILESENTGAYYIGSTQDLNTRLQLHNQGKNRSTKSGVPWKVKGYKIYSTRSEAYREEQRLKRMKSRKRVESWLTTANSTEE